LSRIEIIRQRFLRRLHRAVFNTVPNNAPEEVDLSKLNQIDDQAREQGLDFSFALRVQATSNDAQVTKNK
jgi:hypothetical protein